MSVSLDFLCGSWRDERGTSYDVKLDGSRGTTCSVSLVRLNDEYKHRHRVVKVETRAGEARIVWSRSYFLDGSVAFQPAAQKVVWYPLPEFGHNKKPFTWHRSEGASQHRWPQGADQPGEQEAPWTAQGKGAAEDENSAHAEWWRAFDEHEAKQDRWSGWWDAADSQLRRGDAPPSAEDTDGPAADWQHRWPSEERHADQWARGGWEADAAAADASEESRWGAGRAHDESRGWLGGARGAPAWRRREADTSEESRWGAGWANDEPRGWLGGVWGDGWPDAEQGAEGGAAAASAGPREERASGNRDWQCPDTSCINHTRMVFGRNATCPRCGAERRAAPGAAAATGAALEGPHSGRRKGPYTEGAQEGLALVDRGQVLCANPTCRFLVHPDACFGGYCCRRCHWVHETCDAEPHDRHGCRCQRRPAPPGAPRAAPVPPHEVYRLFGSI